MLLSTTALLLLPSRCVLACSVVFPPNLTGATQVYSDFFHYKEGVYQRHWYVLTGSYVR